MGEALLRASAPPNVVMLYDVAGDPIARTPQRSRTSTRVSIVNGFLITKVDGSRSSGKSAQAVARTAPPAGRPRRIVIGPYREPVVGSSSSTL